MKKAALLLTVLLVGFFLFTGQKTLDGPKWDSPIMSHAWLTNTNVPYMPVNNLVTFNTKTFYLFSPTGIFAVGPNFIPYPTTATQSEVHAYSNPNVPGKIFIGWNSYGPSFYGTGFAVSTNTGVNWTGSNTLPGLAVNSGDPSCAINSSATIFMNAIGASASTQVITSSTNNGVNWSPYVTIYSGSSTQDKNHITIDDKSTSPYYNNLYVGWTDFGATNYPAKVARSTDNGSTWSTVQVTAPISGHFSQGVNLHTNHLGHVYMVCATNINSSPYTEDYIGFAKSTNGGVNWTVNEQAIDINGIRGNLKTSSIRVNSFPWMAVDKTGGPRNGWIYVTWAQRNLAPAGTDPDICFARSTDAGSTWSTPVRVNDDPLNNGRDQWFSNINVDAFGGINIVFYDSRNPSTNDSAEVYVARSVDGGNTWTNIKVSDHRFRPVPISGLASGYQGDYIGITSTNNALYPFWADNYTGTYQVWTAKIDLGPAINHTPLGNTEQTTGSRPVNCQIIPAGSGINPSLTRLYYSKDNPNITNYVQMTNTSGTNWTANLPLSGAGLYRYYITTTDSLNRVATAPAGAPANYYSFTANPDTVKPVINHTPLGNVPKENWPATVSANVTDNIGIDSVWVKWYKNNTGTGIKQFRLNFVSGNTYSAPFNSTQSEVNINDSIFYRIFARDNSSNHNTDSTQLYTFKIINIVNACLGTGTLTSNYPFTTYWMDGRTQFLYLASELTPLVGGAANIQKIGFNVISASSQLMDGFNVRFQNTSLTSLTTFISTGWTTCYTGTYTVPGTGWQYINLTTPFYWNGTSNLLVEICYNNSSWTAYSPVYATSATSMMVGQYSDLSTGDGCTQLTSPSVLTYRANTCFTMEPVISTVSNSTNGIPNEYRLMQNYPNPFNPVTKISFDIPKQGLVTLKIYDVLGREVRTLVNEVKNAGSYTVDFNAADLSSGVYFYKLEVNGFSDVKRMMLIK
jgi:hypothetical protein